MNLFGTTISPIVAFFLLGEMIILAALVTAFIMARLHRGTMHHYVMLTAFLTDVLVFKPLMFSRASTAFGSFPWHGTRIAPHFLIALSAALIGASAVVLGYKFRIKKGPKMLMPPKGRIHRILGWSFLAVWSVALAVGLLIFIEMYYP